RTYFSRPNQLPYERRTLGIALSGNRIPPTWQQPGPGPYSFYDIKGMLESLQRTLRVDGWETCAAEHPALHPGRAAVVRLAGRDVAVFGELHPDVATRFEIEAWPVQVAEVDLDTLF